MPLLAVTFCSVHTHGAAGAARNALGDTPAGRKIGARASARAGSEHSKTGISIATQEALNAEACFDFVFIRSDPLLAFMSRTRSAAARLVRRRSPSGERANHEEWTLIALWNTHFPCLSIAVPVVMDDGFIIGIDFGRQCFLATLQSR
jgi:hypothetical protein